MAKKIVFMGTPMFAVPILKSLYQNGYPITCVYTQPPQKSHRGQKINKAPVQGSSETLNLDYRAPSTLKENNSHLILNPVGCIKQIDVKNIIELIRYKLKES